ncbi:MAG: hypothetical protein OXH06_04540 [Gemmatimonadetes bacterium]|nr:hypothetical protein [Gemmatimonadota bacterium]
MTRRIASALIIASHMIGCGRSVPTATEIGTELKGFKLAGRMNFQRFWPASVLLQDGRVLITGGSRTDRPYHSSRAFRHATAELFDPDTGTSTVTGSMSVSRYRDRAMLLPDGRVIVKGTPFDPPEVYDPRSGSFVAMEDRPELTTDASIAALPTGDLLTIDAKGNVSRFDPDSWEFQFLTRMDVPRSGHSASLLQDGRLLIVGGANGAGALKRTDVYDPSSNTLAQVGDLRHERWGHQAVLLEDGTVLILGGMTGAASDPEDVSAAERYEPATGSFMPAGDPRIAPLHAVALLPNGTVFLMGGINGSVVLYDSSTNDYRRNGDNVGYERVRYSVTVLRDGRVLVFGGMINGVSTDQVLVYRP